MEKRLQIKWNFLNLIKNMYFLKTAAYITLNGKKIAFLLRSGIRQGCPLSTLLSNNVLEALANAIK
jgi:hypothetical protein